MSNINLDWRFFSQSYLETVLSEAKEQLNSIRDANKDLYQRATTIMQYSILAVTGIFVYLLSKDVNEKYYNITMYSFICSVVIMILSIIIWLPYTRVSSGENDNEWEGILLHCWGL